MKASELIQKLTRLVKEHGDLEVRKAIHWPAASRTQYINEIDLQVIEVDGSGIVNQKEPLRVGEVRKVIGWS
jgi:hypothetical protein